MKAPKIRMRGCVGMRLDVLQPEHIAWLKKRLTITSTPYKDQEPATIKAFHIEDGYIWLPRYFDHLEYWPKIREWEWVEPPLDYELQQLMTPDPARKQPEAIEALESALRRDSGTIGVCPGADGDAGFLLAAGGEGQGEGDQGEAVPHGGLLQGHQLTRSTIG